MQPWKDQDIASLFINVRAIQEVGEKIVEATFMLSRYLKDIDSIHRGKRIDKLNKIYKKILVRMETTYGVVDTILGELIDKHLRDREILLKNKEARLRQKAKLKRPQSWEEILKRIRQHDSNA